LVLLAGPFIQTILCQANLDQAIKNFESNDWVLVSEARTTLEEAGMDALPALFSLLKEDKIVKLTNTGDLIYPGAVRFYGHGEIIDYDIDQLPVRAGWLIEKITFQNFGFSYIHDLEINLVNHIKYHFSSSEIEQFISKPVNSLSIDEQRELIKDLSVYNAQNWWKDNASADRLDCLESALSSKDDKRQVDALQYLRTSTVPVEGLTKEAYNKKLLPQIKKLAGDQTKRISEQAKYILNDKTYEFLKIKGL
ncbi:MAG TPA: hypothetical protein VE912_10880, partial [Bacteroidales bacterium]|nr:hypothetical protein [Bacteroidales bacterium]